MTDDNRSAKRFCPNGPDGISSASPTDFQDAPSTSRPDRDEELVDKLELRRKNRSINEADQSNNSVAGSSLQGSSSEMPLVSDLSTTSSSQSSTSAIISPPVIVDSSIASTSSSASSSNGTLPSLGSSLPSTALGRPIVPSSKVSKKGHSRQQSRQLNSPTSHGRCLYFPGAYSSHGQLSHLQRRQCTFSHCCHCQHPFVPCTRISNNHELGQVSATSSSGVSNLRSAKPDSSSAFVAEASATSSTNSSTSVRIAKQGKNAESLLEIASRLVAEHIPYEYIEQRYSCIPEPVQRRIIFWSFPRDESYIRLYSSISSIFKHESSSGSTNYHISGAGPKLPEVGLALPPAVNTAASSSSASQSEPNPGSQLSANASLFNSGLLLMLSGAVHQVMQVGFNLSGVVTNPAPFNSVTSGSGSLYTASSGAASAIDPTSFNLINLDFARSSASVHAVPYINLDTSPLYSRKNSTSYVVSITFDRCKITSVTCTCILREYHLFWCEHVVALALYRIRKPLAIELRVPISETLLQFDRDQLQKLVQYLIAEHHVQILPTVQRLADELSFKKSPINLIAGAPDPTAGACVFGPHDWYLNEEKISAQVRDLVKYVSIPESKKIILLFYKVIEMLKIKDSNGPRFLRIITEQFLYSYSHYLKPEDSFERFDPFIFLWDHLTNLWIFIVADPSMPPLKRVEWREMFRHWSHLANCPREDSYFSLEVDTGNDPRYGHSEIPQRNYYYNKFDEENGSDVDYLRRRIKMNTHFSSSSSSSSSRPRRRRILERALDATYLTWDDTHLQLILRQDGPIDRSSFLYFSEYFDRDGFPIWSEHLPTACVRVASLRINGHKQEALRLSMAIVRYLRHCQHQKQQQQKQMKLFCDFEVAPASESWIGNPVDPIGVLFDTLAEASLTPESKPIDSYYALVGFDKKIDLGIFSKNVLVDVFVMYNEANVLLDRNNSALSAETIQEHYDRPRYRHIPVTGSVYNWDTYLAAAVSVALIGLSQHRRSPDLESQRDKTYRHEERLIRKLLDIKLDSILTNVLRQQARYLLEFGLLSDLVTLDNSSKNVPVDIAQIPGLARYMFGALLTTDSNLAYEIGLRSLRFFAFKEERSSPAHLTVRSNLALYLDVQLILAKTMLFAARNDSKRLEIIFHTIRRYVSHPPYLNKLAQDIFQFSLNGTRHEHLLRIAYAFGLHLTKITLNDSDSDHCRKNIIQWLVTCASEIGCDNVLHLMNSWQEYFTPSEAVRLVASTVLSPNFNARICNHILRQDELASTARKLAVECALQDPANCALNALSLCEKDQLAFDTISQVVEKAGTIGQMSSLKLFTIARYMEHQGVSDRACKIALLAAGQVVIPLTADSHHSIGDLQWACSLAQSLGTNELNELVNILIKNVRCAPVLADMIRRCTYPPQPMPAKHVMLHSGIRSNFIHDTSNLTYIEHISIDERMRRRQFKAYPLDRPPLSNLLYAAVKAYIETVMKRLEHISPRHYSDFIEFLTRAQETIILAPDGKNDFAKLLEKIKSLYKGKKKLMFLVKERFG